MGSGVFEEFGGTLKAVLEVILESSRIKEGFDAVSVRAPNAYDLLSVESMFLHILINTFRYSSLLL